MPEEQIPELMELLQTASNNQKDLGSKVNLIAHKLNKSPDWAEATTKSPSTNLLNRMNRL